MRNRVKNRKYASREVGWTKEQWEEFKSKATSGDYNNLLGVVTEYFEVM